MKSPDGCAVTVLTSRSGQALAKVYAPATNGTVGKKDFVLVRQYSAREASLGGIADLHRLLIELERTPASCIIRGQAKPDINLANTRRCGAAFDEVPRRWLMLDLDGVPMPPGGSVLDSPHDTARGVLDLLAGAAPDLDGVTAIVQFSASAGLNELAEAEAVAGLPPQWDGVAKDGISVHVWFWLSAEHGASDLTRWAKGVNERAGYTLIDPATTRTVQIHYTAGPVFNGGLIDPLAGRRTLLLPGLDNAATLVIPDVVPRAPYAPGQAPTGLDYSQCLDAIGGVGGFHGPILRAVLRGVTEAWPHVNREAIIDAIAGRVLAADPGGRTASDVARYGSSPFITAIIGWAVEKLAERDASARKSAVSVVPCVPTFPRTEVTLAEAQVLAGKDLATFATKIEFGGSPELLLKMTAGSGKTRAAIAALPALMKAGRKARRGPVLFCHPRHTLGAEIAGDVHARWPNLAVAVHRGMTAINPETLLPMCVEPAIPAAARAAGLGQSDACGMCPVNLDQACAYIEQVHAETLADVIIAPHQVLSFTPFRGWPRAEIFINGLPTGQIVPEAASAIIIDEDFTGSMLAGLDLRNPIQLALSALTNTTTPGMDGNDRDALLRFRKMAGAAFEKMPAGPVQRTALVAAGFAPLFMGLPICQPAHDWEKLEWQLKPKLGKPDAGAGRAGVLAVLADAGVAGFSRLMPMLASAIARFMATGDHGSVEMTFVPDAPLGGDLGTGAVIRFAFNRPIHEDWQGARLFLDATASPEKLRYWAPDLEAVVIDVAARHQHVTQIVGARFSRTMLTQTHNVRRLADLAMTELAAAGELLVVCQVAVEPLLSAQIEGRGGVSAGPGIFRFPNGSTLHVAHFGDLTGSNAWQHVPAAIIAGRPATNCSAAERMAEVIRGRAGERAHGETDQFPTRPAAICMRDGTGHRIEAQPWHPDELTEVCRSSVSEGGVLQALARLRGVQRTQDNPCRIILLGEMALPLDVDAVTSWAEIQPGKLAVAVAEAGLCLRAMPLAPADMLTARPDIWGSESSAKRDLVEFERSKVLMMVYYKQSEPFKTVERFRYRTGPKGRASQAIVPVWGGRQALERIVGPLTLFEPMPVPVAKPDIPVEAPTESLQPLLPIVSITLPPMGLKPPCGLCGALACQHQPTCQRPPAPDRHDSPGAAP